MITTRQLTKQEKIELMYVHENEDIYEISPFFTEFDMMILLRYERLFNDTHLIEFIDETHVCIKEGSTIKIFKHLASYLNLQCRPTHKSVG